MIRKTLILSTLYFIVQSAMAQAPSIGQWRSHLPYQNTIAVEETDNKIYCASGSSVFYVNKADNSMHSLSKVDGLSDVGISCIRYSHETQSLVIVYTNSNIDVITSNNTIHNIPDLKNTLITGSKKVNAITCNGDYAYLASDLGIIVVSLDRFEIKDTYTVASNPADGIVNNITFSSSAIYAATNKGIYVASLNGSLLNSFQSWSKLPYRTDRPFNYITYFNNKLYANTSKGYDQDSIFSYNGAVWKYFAPASIWWRRKLDVQHGKLVVVDRFSLSVYDTSETKIVYDSPPAKKPKSDANVFDGLIDNANVPWIADNSDGLNKKAQSNSNIPTYYIPDSPYSEKIFNITSSGNAVWYTTGGHDVSWNNTFNHDGISSLINNQWRSYTPYNSTAIDTTFDYMSIAIDPSNSNHIYLSTFSAGVLEFKDGNCIKDYKSDIGPGNLVYTCGIELDNNNNLWTLNTFNESLLSMKSPAGKWYAYKFAPIPPDVSLAYRSFLLIDDYNQKWFLLPRSTSPAIGIFNENQTFDDLTDDYADTLNLTVDYQGTKEGAFAQCITKDQEGNIWVGTDKGIVVFYAPGLLSKQTPKPRAQQILIQQDGYNQYLLSTDVVNAIAVDGANRKWFGTEKGGVFLFSPDGTKQLLHFDVDNSPLPSNAVSSIAINNVTGEVFIGTDKGLVSYHGTATAGGVSSAGAYAYPNPVPHNFTGKIGITGLATNSTVKITDVSGNMVYETPAEGGTAIWDGSSKNGNRVESGVYLVFALDSKGEQTFATKILFIK